MASVRVGGAPPAELEGYWREAFGRFAHTLELARALEGTALELGANPYFLTVLLTQYTRLDLTLANFFGGEKGVQRSQEVSHRSRDGHELVNVELTSSLFDAESDPFPFRDGAFDVVLFCEILEHMTEDPLSTLREIHRVLRADGHLVLTTPNVGRLENVARLLLGQNIYDPYSGYGPHGRHNREYNPHELALLLEYAGFDIEVMYTADSHLPTSEHVRVAAAAGGMSVARCRDLGQYIFVRARRRPGGRTLRPSFLYRSYPPGEIEEYPRHQEQ